MTASDLITSTFRLIGTLASGETPTSSESNDALTSLNEMINTWSNERLMIYEKTYELLALVVNQQTYQWGVGAPDFNTSRPFKIEDLNWQQVSATTTLELPIEILNSDQWAAISIKEITSNIPTRAWLEMTNPYAKLHIWPIPSVTGNIAAYTWKALSQISSLTSTITLPPGYTRALRYNLALELAPEYGRQLSELVIQNAINSKAALKTVNNKILLMSCDEATLNKRSTWNWYTGE